MVVSENMKKMIGCVVPNVASIRVVTQQSENKHDYVCGMELKIAKITGM